MERITQKMKDEIMETAKIRGCTLDGKPAKVIGRRLDFAVVAMIDRLHGVEYSWPAVKRILDNDGKFSS